MPAKTRQCRRCEHATTSLVDHLEHISTAHRDEARRLRPASCHRCAAEIDVNVTRTCVCGFTLPEAN